MTNHPALDPNGDWAQIGYTSAEDTGWSLSPEQAEEVGQRISGVPIPDFEANGGGWCPPSEAVMVLAEQSISIDIQLTVEQVRDWLSLFCAPVSIPTYRPGEPTPDEIEAWLADPAGEEKEAFPSVSVSRGGPLFQSEWIARAMSVPTEVFNPPQVDPRREPTYGEINDWLADPT